MPPEEHTSDDKPKMTGQEHLLMIHLFYLQMMTIKALLTALKSHGILELDDIEAYSALVVHEEIRDSAMMKKVREVYQSVAKEYGIEIRYHES